MRAYAPDEPIGGKQFSHGWNMSTAVHPGTLSHCVTACRSGIPGFMVSFSLILPRSSGSAVSQAVQRRTGSRPRPAEHVVAPH